MAGTVRQRYVHRPGRRWLVPDRLLFPRVGRTPEADAMGVSAGFLGKTHRGVHEVRVEAVERPAADDVALLGGSFG